MAATRWLVEEQPSFQSAGLNPVRVFRVRPVGSKTWDGHDVWLSDRSVRCTGCSGPLTGMLASCAHAQAVRRRYPNG